MDKATGSPVLQRLLTALAKIATTASTNHPQATDHIPARTKPNAAQTASKVCTSQGHHRHHQANASIVVAANTKTRTTGIGYRRAKIKQLVTVGKSLQVPRQ